MYITIEEFISFGGRDFENISEFDKVCLKAEGIINYYTQNRLDGKEDVPRAVKLCMYELCELILDGNSGVSSYSSDGVSVKLSEKESFADKAYEIIRRNLPSRLLYLGVDKL